MILMDDFYFDIFVFIHWFITGFVGMALFAIPFVAVLSWARDRVRARTNEVLKLRKQVRLYNEEWAQQTVRCGKVRDKLIGAEHEIIELKKTLNIRFGVRWSEDYVPYLKEWIKVMGDSIFQDHIYWCRIQEQRRFAEFSGRPATAGAHDRPPGISGHKPCISRPDPIGTTTKFIEDMDTMDDPELFEIRSRVGEFFKWRNIPTYEFLERERRHERDRKARVAMDEKLKRQTPRLNRTSPYGPYTWGGDLLCRMERHKLLNIIQYLKSVPPLLCWTPDTYLNITAEGLVEEIITLAKLRGLA